MTSRRQCFTIVEITIVLVITSVLATLGIPQIGHYMERIKNKEAAALVNTLRAAEKMYQLKHGVFKTCGDNAACNAALQTRISSSEWSCAVTTAANGQVQCTRVSSDGRIWQAYSDSVADPSCSAGGVNVYCPAGGVNA